MHAYALSHLSDAMLLRDLTALVVRDRQTTALLLAHIAEVDARRLYVPAGFPSMHAYCVDELRLSEDAALKRIQAARAARRFPALFEAVAEGRFHLSGVCLLAPYLTEANVAELLEEASGHRKSEIEAILARRFPLASELPATLRPITTAPSWLKQLAPAQVDGDNGNDGSSEGLGVGFPLAGTNGDCMDEHTPAHVEGPSQGRFLLQVAVSASTREKLQYAQALLSHAVPSGDVAQVLDRALDALIGVLEKRKVGAGMKAGSRQAEPRQAGPLQEGSGRHVPAHVRSAVWERDGGQCTFVSASGRRCEARRFLEYDHIDPVARGGKAAVDRMRLRCRAHNQYEAERTFGVEFMRGKRGEARRVLRDRQRLVPAPGQVPKVDSSAAAVVAEKRAAAVERTDTQQQDLLAGLRHLGFRIDEARRAVEHTKLLHGVALEERFRAALQYLGQGRAQIQRAPTSG